MITKILWLVLVAASLVELGISGLAVAQVDTSGGLVQGRPGWFSRLPRKPVSSAVRLGLQSPAPAIHGNTGTAANQGTFVTFDAPNAGFGGGQGTTSVSINPSGAVTGYYADASFLYHGFVRFSDCADESLDTDCGGTVVSFDVPGAGMYARTTPVSINPSGAITGFYFDANSTYHGFLRQADTFETHRNSPEGIFTTFEIPAAGGGLYQGTIPTAISSSGVIVGYYADSNTVFHGFLRKANGALITFDVPGAGTDFAEGTFGVAINSGGAITGFYAGTGYAPHGFLRAPDGTLTAIEVPGGTYTSPSSIDDSGSITGTYKQPIVGNPFGYNLRGFVRNPDGTYVTFDAATYAPCCIWTWSDSINPAGATTGYDNDGYNRYHGFLRASDGTITLFDAPGAAKGNFQGTLPLSINPEGTVTGYFTDSKSTNHGFLLFGAAKRR